jgi:DNA-binding response OmpR family regulator
VKILVVDDDPDLRELIVFALRQAGYAVVQADDGPRAVAVFGAETPGLVVLDVNLPGFDGLEVCRRIRARSAAPILVLTVRDTEEDEIRALDSGADDYLTKPFSPATLLARVRALLRRAGEPAPRLVLGDLALDPDRSLVVVAEAEVKLTGLELRLLQILFAHAGRVVATARLLQHVWGAAGEDRQALKQLVHRLRQKLEPDPAQPRYLLTASGEGYRLRGSIR